MIQYKLYHSFKDLPSSWDALPINDVFLKTPFLNALEDSTPKNISIYYLGVFSSEKLVGIAIIQRVEMYFDDVIRKTSNQFFKRFGKWLISKIIKGNALVIGNLMHTGQHGIFFDPKHITLEEFLNTLSEAIDVLKTNIRREFNKKIRIIAYKDYFQDDFIHKNTSYFKKHKLYKTQVQPNMIFGINEDWTSPSDYVSAFNKKYRNRYRSARKKSKDIACNELTLENIQLLSTQLFELYENVSDNAGVNSFKLNKDHFYNMKLRLKDNFKVFGYFLNEELIGFYTLIVNDEKLETYFLGYKQKLQHSYKMYLNMLFDMAFYGIENNFKSVIFARTAMEIKSSIGAKPYNMFIYIKHTNNIIANSVLKLVVKYANPIREWQERHPFK